MSRFFLKIFSVVPLFRFRGCDSEVTGNRPKQAKKAFIDCYYGRLMYLLSYRFTMDGPAIGRRIKIVPLPAVKTSAEFSGGLNSLFFYYMCHLACL